MRVQGIILFVHIFVSVVLICVILIQHGKGADVGASFGSGSANTMFGSAGPTSFLMKFTSFFAIIFLITSLSLLVMSTGRFTSKKSLAQEISYLSSIKEARNGVSKADGNGILVKQKNKSEQKI